MSAVWNAIIRLFEASTPEENRAKQIGKLLRHVEATRGEHEADILRGIIQRGSSPEALEREISDRYMDSRINGFLAAMRPAADDDRKVAARRPVAVEPVDSRDKGSGESEPIPQRPDRVGAGPQPDPMPRSTGIDTKSKNFQAVGTAGQNMAQDQPSLKQIPRTKETDYVQKLKAALRNDDWMRSKIASIVRKSGMTPAEAKHYIEKEVEKKIKSFATAKSAYVPADVSAVTRKPKDVETMSDTELDKLGKDASKGPSGSKTVKPTFDGEFIGQRWAPNAYSSSGGKDVGIGGGAAGQGGGFSNQATGNKQGSRRQVNPASPGTEWRAEHDLIWGGKENGGWLTKSQFAALVGQGKIRRKNSDPSKPDLSKHRVVSPVNPPKK